MSFDSSIFAAEIALGLIPSEEMPLRAQDAMEAGFDGEALVRLAILEKPSGWEVDQWVPRVLEELHQERPELGMAALRLARSRAHRILESNEDPLPSLGYFHMLLLQSDYEAELFGLAYADENTHGGTDDEVRAAMREAAEELLDPELAALRKDERRQAWEEEQRRAKAEWPYVLNSISGRKLFRERWKERLTYVRPLLWVGGVSATALGWSLSSWKVAAVVALFFPPYIAAASAFGVWREMKRERQQILWRRGYEP